MRNLTTILARLCAVVALVALFGAVMIAAGHGAGPIAYLVLFGRASQWLPGQVLGWLGLLVCAIAVFRGTRRSYLATLVCGLGLLVFSAVAFSVAGESVVA